MPTKKKRIGFIPREDVMKIIDKLSFENNLSNSKIISLLVEEALTNRGIYNINIDKEKQFLIRNIKDKFSNKSKEDNDPLQINQIDKNKNYSKEYFNNMSYNEKFELQTYEKFLMFLKFQEMISIYEK